MSGGWQGSDRKQRLPDDWPQRRQRILRRDRHTCQLAYLCCLIKANQVDHIEPNDDHDESNLQAACAECHEKKSAREGVEARARIRAASRRKPRRHPGLIH